MTDLVAREWAKSILNWGWFTKKTTKVLILADALQEAYERGVEDTEFTTLQNVNHAAMVAVLKDPMNQKGKT